MPRTAKVFMTNRSQAVRLPKEYQFATTEDFFTLARTYLPLSDLLPLTEIYFQKTPLSLLEP